MEISTRRNITPRSPRRTTPPDNPLSFCDPCNGLYQSVQPSERRTRSPNPSPSHNVNTATRNVPRPDTPQTPSHYRPHSPRNENISNRATQRHTPNSPRHVEPTYQF